MLGDQSGFSQENRTTTKHYRDNLFYVGIMWILRTNFNDKRVLEYESLESGESGEEEGIITNYYSLKHW